MIHDNEQKKTLEYGARYCQVVFTSRISLAFQGFRISLAHGGGKS
jgi:hypothetical protein